MKRLFPALGGLLLLATAALALGGCGHWHHGHHGHRAQASSHGAYACADGHRHGPGCGHPYAP